MGYPTPIEWTDATWNPVGGCEIESPGCLNCYAMKLAASPRLKNHPLYAGTTTVHKGRPIFNGILTALPETHKGWTWPLSWRGAKDRKLGPARPSLIFPCDMSDLFHPRRPLAHIDRVVAALLYSRHIGQPLTKRPANMLRYIEGLWRDARWLLLPHPVLGVPNFDPVCATWENAVVPRLWLGFSAERQREMFDRAVFMRTLVEMGFQIFVSVEPMLERIVLPTWFGTVTPRPWIIAGGESGPDARTMHPDWVRAIRDQAGELGCPFFFKQWGEWAPYDRSRFVTGHVDEPIQNFGKKLSGRLLDGIEYNAFPEAA